MNAFMNYLRGSVEELRHVRWPTRQQAVRLSLITIVFIVLSAVSVGIIDTILTGIIGFLLQ
jgi:preprotein translocase SecE subunit